MIKLFIPGIPGSKQSFRVGGFRGGKFIAYKDKKVEQNENNIRAVVLGQLDPGFVPFAGGVVVNLLTYIFPPLKTFNRKTLQEIEQGGIVYKTTKPDLTDNLNKALFDALQGIIYINDSQICEIRQAQKIYGTRPGILLEIGEIKQDG